MKQVALIIVNYNGKNYLEECIDSINLTEAKETEIIIIDNASTDGSQEYIKRNFPSINLIELDRNVGFAKANNIGAKVANGKYLLFLNNDTVVTKGWLVPLVKTLEEKPEIGVVGSKLLLYNFSNRINSAGANIVFNGGGYDIGFMEEDKGQFNNTRECGAVCAASMMVRKEEFLALGGFDSDYFMYFEDVDLCWRYWLAGYKVVYVPKSVVYHRFGGTSGFDRHSPLKVFYGTRNCLFNIFKNYEIKNIIYPFGFNIFFNFFKFFYLLSFKPYSAIQIPKAYFSFIKNLPVLYKKRKDIQRLRRIKDSFLFKKDLIIGLSIALKEFKRLSKKQK